MRRFLSLLLILALSTLALADDSKLAPELIGISPTATVNVIVQYNQAPTTSLLQGILNLGGQLLEALPIVNGLVATLTGNQILNLSNQSNVVYISSDRQVLNLLSNAAPAINAPTAWSYGYTGKGIGVAVVDSGINTVADLNGGSTLFGLLPASRVVYSQNFVPWALTAGDQYGHGTHVAGLIAGNGADSTGPSYFRTFKGIAPNANLINLRVLDQNGAGTDSQVIAAISQAISLKSSYNIRVLNLSLGRPVFESYRLDPLCQAVEAAWKAGIVVVVAAGNDGRDNSFGTQGYGTITAPGNDPYVITVGSMKPMGTPTRTDDLIASYSSKGPTVIDHIVKPDIVAPGNLLVSLGTSGTLEKQFPANDVPNSAYIWGGNSSWNGHYFVMSGTSMAAGVASGAVAGLLQAHPTLTPDQVKARLMATAYKTFPRSSSVTDPTTGITYTDYYDIFTIGAGYLDMKAALGSSLLASGNAMSPIAVLHSSDGNAYLSKDASAVWGTSSAWSSTTVWGSPVFINPSSALWGSNALWGSTALWGSSALWGSTTDSGSSALWGSNALWGSSALWGSNALWGSSALWGSGSVGSSSAAAGEN